MVDIDTNDAALYHRKMLAIKKKSPHFRDGVIVWGEDGQAAPDAALSQLSFVVAPCFQKLCNGNSNFKYDLHCGINKYFNRCFI